MTQLKPCPFCGSSNLTRSWQSATQIAVECQRCEAHGPLQKSQTMQGAKENAHETWNNRVSPWRSLKDDPPDPDADWAAESLRSVLVRNLEREHLYGRIIKLVRGGNTWRDDDRENPWTLQQYMGNGFTEWMEIPS